MARLKLGFSPCPNDTFVFHRMLQEHGDDYEVFIEDVEELNGRAVRGELDIAKISVAAYGLLESDWALLRSGGAAGFGVGPLLVAREQRDPGGRPGGHVAIPGDRTTAALLLRLLGDFETVSMRFDEIEPAVARGDVDMGVLIHEGRFTHKLVQLADLGEVWEQRMKQPLPLGAIAIRRELGEELARETDARIRASVEHAMKRPDDSAAFVREHAQEMAPAVVRQHIELYVNDYTLAMDEGAVESLLKLRRDRCR